MNSQVFSLKIIIMGFSGVGKSSVALNYTHNIILTEFNQAHGDEFKKTIQINDHTILLEIYDTSEDEFVALRNQYIKQGDGFVLIYSITSKESFEEIKGIYEEIYRVKHKDKNEPIPIIIVGNKCDLENEREVTKEEGMNYADSINCPFIECSAKTKENINQIFEIITRNILEQKYQREEEEIWTIKKPKREKGCCVV
ncbi:hypothetical protein, conserved [Entamoeba dispar SAW760]|uniref:Uncharacterized protein n=1 Tax=Entamoeba dispar (strain ATCC PRA-260 / SAW760) TaxID=370354 RepID=B0EM67_ENTDS|nr:uncharacterized protein EDI_286690 [Entamoeba dispar SAW760]EDR24377.1 hypothetical protein, conserved [Entamoeba dispar SAW760]|eukprot:EDR24377.1 hypothetical protein, conserved [Entamoeba dispar SAW760]